MDFLQGYGLQMLLGTVATLELAFTSMAFGLLLGLLGAAAKMSSWTVVRRGAVVLTNVLRGTPEFIILLVCYYGLSKQFFRLMGHDTQMSPFFGGVFALSVVLGSNASETFRGAFQAVPQSQVEAGRSLGIRPSYVFFLIQLPQAWRLVLPSLNNLWHGLMKDTSLVSVLGMEELMRAASIGGQVSHRPFTFYTSAAAIYFLLLAGSGPVFATLERYASRGLQKG